MPGNAPYQQLDGPNRLSLATKVTLTWAGAVAFSNVLTVSLPGASATCQGVGTCDSAGALGVTVVLNIHDNANGSCNVQGVCNPTTTLPAAGSTCSVFLHLWGA